MLIWVIGRGVPTKQNNMFGSFEFEQACMLQRHGHTVIYPHFVFLSPRFISKWRYSESVKNGVLVCRLGFLNRLSKTRLKVSVRNFFLKRLYRTVSKKHGIPDVIHIHYPTAWSYELFRPYQQQGARIVSTEHWTKVQDGDLSAGYRNNLKKYMDHADAVLSVGEELSESIHKITQSDREISLIPNIVSSYFCYRDQTDPGTFRFVACGRLVEVKGFDLLVRAFYEAFSDQPNVCLDIIGEGNYRGTIQAEIDRLQLNDRVRLLGVMEHRSIAEYFHSCNALVCSSSLETFGVPVIEAMASGLPVVTTDAIGFKQLFGKEHGYIVPSGDCSALAASMKKLCENYSAFDRKGISDYAQEHFSEEVIYRQLINYYTGSNE